MAEDIRIKADFPNHFKVKKLIDLAGHEGVTALITLWCYCRQNKPKGDLSGMSDRDIDIASGFDTKCIRGEYKSFSDCLFDAGFLDQIETGLVLHDWKEHQPWAFYAEERSQKARESVQTRWDKRLKKQEGNTKRIRNVKQSNTESNTPLPTPLPIPSPNPTPKESKLHFDNFWKEYPARNGKKGDKSVTMERFSKLLEAEKEQAIKAAQNYAKSGEITCDAERFLKSKDYPQGRWRGWIPEPASNKTPEQIAFDEKVAAQMKSDEEVQNEWN